MCLAFALIHLHPLTASCCVARKSSSASLNSSPSLPCPYRLWLGLAWFGLGWRAHRILLFELRQGRRNSLTKQAGRPAVDRPTFNQSDVSLISKTRRSSSLSLYITQYTHRQHTTVFYLGCIVVVVVLCDTSFRLLRNANRVCIIGGGQHCSVGTMQTVDASMLDFIDRSYSTCLLLVMMHFAVDVLASPSHTLYTYPLCHVHTHV